MRGLSPVRHFRHFNSVPLVCSWSANSSLQRGFVLGTQLRLDTHSRLHQTGLSIQRRNALRTITAAFDPELHSLLELASDAELSELSSILYGQRSGYGSQPKKRPQSKRRALYLEAIERAKGSRFRHNISSAIRLGSEELLTTILKDGQVVAAKLESQVAMLAAK